MEFEIHKQEQQMLVYWDQSGGGPQMRGTEEERMEDPKVKTILTP